MKNMHGFEIVVDADKSDWGKHWGIVPDGDKRCWCYLCSMKRPQSEWKKYPETKIEVSR